MKLERLEAFLENPDDLELAGEMLAWLCECLPDYVYGGRPLHHALRLSVCVDTRQRKRKRDFALLEALALLGGDRMALWRAVIEFQGNQWPVVQRHREIPYWFEGIERPLFGAFKACGGDMPQSDQFYLDLPKKFVANFGNVCATLESIGSDNFFRKGDFCDE